MYETTVNETSPPEYPRPQPGFLNLTCISSHYPITYSILHLTSANLPFTIDSETGELNTTADIDYDLDTDFFSFNVSCSNHLRNSSALVVVHIAPVNEFLPEIDPCLVLNITEATPSGTLLLSSLPGGLRRLSVVDRDRGPHGQLNFSLLTPLDDHFSFHPLHANLTLERAVDFETEASMFTYLYHEVAIKIRVCDSATPLEACPIIHFPLFIVATDDNEPVFLNTSYSAAVPESAVIGSSLLRLECSDADILIGGVRKIRLLDPPSDVEETFSLGELRDDGSVDLLLERELDFDQMNQSYQFQVSCEDLQHMATATVTITILDDNDNSPLFSKPLHETVAVPDTAPPGPIISVSCTDQDSGSNADIVYEILPPHSLFAVDQAGHVLVEKPLLLPKDTLSQSHNISVQCSDSGSPSLSSNKSLTVTVYKAVNTSSVTIPENSPTGLHVLTLSVYDPDSEAVSISISSQTVPGTFIVYPSGSYTYHNYPKLILSGSLDREVVDTHIVNVVATSVPPATDGSLNVSFSVTVNVRDVNDNPPDCSEVQMVSITTGSAHSLSLSCSDPDLGLNQQLSYSLIDTHPPVDGNHFVVDQISGKVVLNGDAGEGEYTLTVKVSDMGDPPMSTNVVIHVDVKNKDTNSPVLSLGLILIILVVIMLVLVGVASGCGLCCCYYNRVRARKRKHYFIRSEDVIIPLFIHIIHTSLIILQQLCPTNQTPIIDRGDHHFPSCSSRHSLHHQPQTSANGRI